MNIWQLHLYSRRNYASTFFNHFSHFISKIPWLAVLSQWIPNSIFWRNGGRKMPNIVKRKSPPNKFLNFFSLLHCFIFHSFFSSFFFFLFSFFETGSLTRQACMDRISQKPGGPGTQIHLPLPLKLELKMSATTPRSTLFHF